MFRDTDRRVFRHVAIHCRIDGAHEHSLGNFLHHIRMECDLPNTVNAVCGCCGNIFLSLSELTAHVNQPGFRKIKSSIPKYRPDTYDARSDYKPPTVPCRWIIFSIIMCLFLAAVFFGYMLLIAQALRI